LVGGIALAIVLPQRFRNSSSALLRAISRPRGVQPSGPGGAWTRRDRWRAAGAQAIGAVVFIGLGVGVLTLADHWPPGTPQNNAGAFVGMVTFFYGMFLPKNTPSEILPTSLFLIHNTAEKMPVGDSVAAVFC
jgi:hypothetical protein